MLSIVPHVHLIPALIAGGSFLCFGMLFMYFSLRKATVYYFSEDDPRNYEWEKHGRGQLKKMWKEEMGMRVELDEHKEAILRIPESPKEIKLTDHV